MSDVYLDLTSSIPEPAVGRCAGQLVSHPYLGLGKVTEYDRETGAATIWFLNFAPGVIFHTNDPASSLHWHNGDENAKLFRVVSDCLMEILPPEFLAEGGGA